MIWYYLILFITSILTATFSWLPKVETLPEILGVDIDAQLSSGVGMFYALTDTFWPLRDIFLGALVLFGYYAVKLILRAFLGHRAPQ